MTQIEIPPCPVWAKNSVGKPAIEALHRREQLKRFRKAAREAGVDPDVDVDEVMRRLAAQEKHPKKRKGANSE